MFKDQIGNRMKNYYENISKTQLMRRCPVIIRLDGKAAHTFTRNFAKPFDEVFQKSMRETMKYLCENIQGCVLGYHFSDEITLVLIDYTNLDTEAWFNYQVQKMCSVSASMATLSFNRFFKENIDEWFDENKDRIFEEEIEFDALRVAESMGLMFDSRCFNIPKEEVCNMLYWRQLDAKRNGLQMVARANFSHKELQNKSCNEIYDMLIEKNIYLIDFPNNYTNGSCCIKEENEWKIDTKVPAFAFDRDYVNKRIFVGE